MGSGEAVRGREPSLVQTRGRDPVVGGGIRRGSTWCTQIPKSGPSSVRPATWMHDIVCLNSPRRCPLHNKEYAEKETKVEAKDQEENV